MQPDTEKQWQPIETAPKDGTHILVFERETGRHLSGHCPFHVVYYRISEFGPDSKDFPPSWSDAEGWAYDPTHWHPLPSPPEEPKP